MRSIVLVLAIIAVAGCSAGSAGVIAQSPTVVGDQSVIRAHELPLDPMRVMNAWSGERSSSLPGHSFVANPNAAGPFIYGCAYFEDACFWFVKGEHAVAGEIAGLNGPHGIGVDPRTGNVYIANTNGSDIKEYPPNSATMIADYQDPGEAPNDVAVDPDGGFFVSNMDSIDGKAPGSVSVFDASGVLLRTMQDATAYVGVSISIDEHDLLAFCFYTTHYIGECDDFVGGKEPAVKQASGWGQFSGGAAFDAADHLVLANMGPKALTTFEGSQTCGNAPLGGVGDPFTLAFDRDSRLVYVADIGNGNILEYPYTDCANGLLHLRMKYAAGLRGEELDGVAVTPGLRI